MKTWLAESKPKRRAKSRPRPQPPPPTALVHAVEGGFSLGGTAEEIAENVHELAEWGVAYVTLAHLFYRQVAANTPARLSPT